MGFFQRFQFYLLHSIKWLGLIILLRFLSMQLITGIHIPIIDDLVAYSFEILKAIAQGSVEFVHRHFSL